MLATISRVLLLSLSCITGIAGLTQEGMYLSVKQVLQTLEKGTLAEREAMMSRVVAARATAKSHEIAQAVAAELARMNQVTLERQQRIAQGILDPNAPGIGEYKGLLVQACAQSSDPVVIDSLIGTINTGNMATDALARFGPQAFDRVVVVALNAEDPTKVTGALDTLRKMLRSQPLTAAQRARIARIADARTQGTQVDIVWSEAMRLAVATGDRDLRARVEAIASGAIEPSVAGPEDMRPWVRDAARWALAARTPR